MEITSETIRQAIERELKHSPRVSPGGINMKVSGGYVTLSGTTENILAKEEAEQIALLVKGVKGVVNNIEVKTPHIPDDKLKQRIKSDIKNRIREELWWSPYVDESEVKVEVNNQKAVLKGTVESEREKEKARENAYEGGAMEVDNRIKVEYTGDKQQ